MTETTDATGRDVAAMKALITGGAGFIGSHLAETLVRERHEVVVLDNFSGGDLANCRELLCYDNFRLVRGDVRDHELVRRLTTAVDMVYHLAAQIHVDRSIVEPRETFDVNLNGTFNILEAARANDVKKVVHASSSEVYGGYEEIPISEKHPLNPYSPYGASKAAADRLCFSYFKTYGLKVVIIRSFNTYGPRQRSYGYGGVIPIFVRRVTSGFPPIIYGDGQQTRDYIYIKDAIAAYKIIAEKDLPGKTVNVGTGREISINELATKVIDLCGMSGRLKPIHVAPRPGEVRRLCADISFARQLSFEPEYDIDTGLREYVEWCKTYGFERFSAQ